MAEPLLSEPNVPQRSQDLFLMAFEYQSTEHQGSSRPYPVYWVLMTDDGTGDNLECFADEEGLDLLRTLTLTRVAQITNIGKFREIVKDMQMQKVGRVYTYDQLMGKAPLTPQENGQPWITKVFDEISRINEVDRILGAGDLSYSMLVFHFAIRFTEEAMKGKCVESMKTPVLDLLTHSEFQELMDARRRVQSLVAAGSTMGASDIKD